MLLKDKYAVIYGAAGSIGSTVAQSFAKEGATVFVTGRTIEKLEALAAEINNAGGKAIAEVVDATNEAEVNDHLQKAIKEFGRIDISFNSIGIDNKQGINLAEMSLAEFVTPITATMHTHFITAMAAAKVMMKQNTGVILTLTATPAGVAYPMVGGFGPACAALENFSYQLAIELGIYGIRVVNIRSGGSPDSTPFKAFMESQPEAAKQVIGSMKNDTMLKELPLINDIANIAVFLASDMAAKITGVTIDATVGTTAGLNYRTSK